MNDKTAMSLARFAALLDAYGASPSRWPEAERAPARALLAREPEAQRLCREAEALDRVLDASVAEEPSAALRRAVAEIPLRHPAPGVASASDAVELPRAFDWLLGSVLRSVLSAAFVLALGAAAGLVTSAASADDQSAGIAVSGTESGDAVDTMLALAFNGSVDEEQAP